MAPVKSSITLTCKHCGEHFQVRPSRITEGRLYCSRRCYEEGRVVPLVDRFRQFVAPPNANGCMLWLGTIGHRGHGSISRGPGKLMVHAHRVAWEIAHGPIPDGLFVLHNCPVKDNPRCVNPSHLFLGTHDDNMADASKKGQNEHGEKHHSAKLTESDVREIQHLHAAGISQADLSRQFGVSGSSIHRIITRRSWKHV